MAANDGKRGKLDRQSGLSKFLTLWIMAICVRFPRARVRDRVLLRLIGKWLKMLECWKKGVWTHPETGNPQGGVISPMLANVYLHYVLDEWFAQEVQPRLKGKSRYRFAYATTSSLPVRLKACWPVDGLGKRLASGLTLRRQDPDGSVPSTTVEEETSRRFPTETGRACSTCWASAVSGRWSRPKRRTVGAARASSGRFTRGLRKISEWCRKNRHRLSAEQCQKLSQELRLATMRITASLRGSATA